MAPKVDTINPGELAASYNFAYSLFQSNPELAKKFRQAVAGDWSRDRFIAELETTKWFRTTADSARNWALLAVSDPATAKARVATRQATLKDQAAALGVTLSGAQLAQMSKNSLIFGWTDQQLRDHLAANWKYNATTASAGLAGQSIEQLRKTASDYLVPLSNKAIGAWTQRILSGDATADDFTEYAKQQARSMFPSMASAIDRGLTVQQFADPYKQAAAQTLGINPEQVDFTDPKWRVALDQVDPKTKERSVMSLADWQTHLRTDSRYGYDTTAQARQSGAQLLGAIGQRMGF